MCVFRDGPGTSSRDFQREPPGEEPPVCLGALFWTVPWFYLKKCRNSRSIKSKDTIHRRDPKTLRYLSSWSQKAFKRFLLPIEENFEVLATEWNGTFFQLPDAKYNFYQIRHVRQRKEGWGKAPNNSKLFRQEMEQKYWTYPCFQKRREEKVKFAVAWLTSRRGMTKILKILEIFTKIRPTDENFV